MEFQFNAPPAEAKPYGDYPIKNWLKCTKNKSNLTLFYSRFLESLKSNTAEIPILLPAFIPGKKLIVLATKCILKPVGVEMGFNIEDDWSSYFITIFKNIKEF